MAGTFTQIGGVAANRIAKWDGTSWSVLGSGLNAETWALAIDSNDNVYAGGLFTSAGGTSGANYVAKWDGTSWSALGSSVNNSVFSLGFDGNDNLYAGGFFTSAGGNSASKIAKWNGTSWSALGSGANSTVWSIAFDSSDNVYAGGFFTSAGSVSGTNHIAKWDGTSWSALGSGVNDDVFTIVFDNAGNLYAGGLFTDAGGVANGDRVAKWNGSSWSALGSGISAPGGLNCLVFDSSGNLYAGGGFTDSGGDQQADYIAKHAPVIAGPTLEVANATLNADSGAISVPVLFTSNGASIASTGFSIDYQESCLSFDSVSGLPAGFTPSITNDPLDTDGELDISLLDDSNPIGALSDGTLLTVNLNVLPACVTTDGSTVNVTVNFSSDPTASFGDTNADDVSGASAGGTLTLQFNATPTDTTLTPSSVDENAASGATVGTLTTTDPDAGDTHTYTLVAGTGDTDNGSFTIVGDQVQTAAVFNFEVKSSYSVRVQTNDGKPNGVFEKAITITINDVNDAPVAVDDLVDPLTTVVVGAASVNIDVLTNDSDEDGDILTVDALTQPAAGSTTDNDSDVSFTGPNANGTTTFTYQATDGLLNSADATVTVNYVKNDLRGDCNGNGSVSAADFVGVVLELFDAGSDPQYQSNPAWWLIYAGGYAGSPIGCDANASKNGVSNDTDSVTAGDIICTVLVFFGDTSCTSGSLVAAAAHGGAAATLQVANVAAEAGATAAVPITLQSDGNIAAAAFTISYDVTSLRFDAADANGDGLPDALDLNLPAGVQAWAQVRDGQIQVVVAGLSLPLSTLPNGVLATATFSVTGSSSTVRLTNASLGDANGAEVSVTTTDGTVGAGNRSIFLPLVTR